LSAADLFASLRAGRSTSDDAVSAIQPVAHEFWSLSIHIEVKAAVPVQHIHVGRRQHGGP
jgi:hypothetical protein